MNDSASRSLPTLDDDVTALLDASMTPLPLPAAARLRIRQRLLRRVAADATPHHLTLQPAQGAWQPLGPGLQIKVLHEDGGVMSYLVRLAAGATLPAHRHPIDEECVVLEGEISIGGQRFGAGTFHLGRRDVLHDSLRSDDGALIYLRGATPEIEHLI
jgi:anti-sigma factor ChrR (cupin superfamily)